MADTNAPPADGGVQSGAPGGAEGAAASWMDSIPDADLKGWAQNKGYKTPVDLASAHRSLEKLLGADRAGRTVVLPAKWDDPKEVGAFYEKLGVPKDPTGYKLPDGADPEMAKWAPSVFHKAGLTPRQAEALTAEWNQMVGGRAEAMKAAYEAKIAEDGAALKSEWGAAYNDKLARAQSAAKALGVKPEVIDKLENTLGHGDLMRFFATIGEKMGEDQSVDGKGQGSFSGAKTPEQARAEITTLRADPEFTRRYVAGDAEAKQRMEQLHKWAYPAPGG